MNGLILVNAYTGATAPRQSERMRAELTRLGVNVTVMRNNAFAARIADGKTVLKRDYDFCLYLDKDKYVSHMLEKHMRLFNRADAIEACDDKMTTHIVLSDKGIPMPDTLPGLLCYDPHAPLDLAAINEAERTLGLPMIIKQSFGSMGSGVFKADSHGELIEIATALKLQPHLFQKYIAGSCGKDVRVIVVGGKVLGGILRTSNTDFRSNIGLGGSASPYDVPARTADIAQKAAAALGLDYCGIDFLFGDDGPLLCEVNSNAFFDAFEATTGINVAAAYAEHIVSQL